jgi:hypothetical protein
MYKNLDDTQKAKAEKQIQSLFSSRTRDNSLSIAGEQAKDDDRNALNKRESVINKFNTLCGLAARSENEKKEKTLTIKQEISHYITFMSQKKLEFDEFWRQNSSKLPLLTQLVKKYCCIPATSVASESAFSLANYVNRKERSSLSERTLRYTMLLQEESKLAEMVFI